ncbi:MAG: hypothetical protein ABI852_08440 [Gemmatimonadaceae bacterium]
MSIGLVLDRADYNIGMVPQWVEGMPEKSFWTGIKTKGHESYKVMTYRCERCGYLESYATEQIQS